MNENEDHMENKMDGMEKNMEENMEELRKSMLIVLLHNLEEKLVKGDIKM